jgi:DNA-binding transcriptional regulator LsrR (DeoR family)
MTPEQRDTLNRCIYYRHVRKPPLKQKDIAQKLRIDPAAVTQLLRIARDTGLVRTQATLEPQIELEERLRERYACLKGVVIASVPLTEEESETPEGSRVASRLVGAATARYLETLLSDRCVLGIAGSSAVAQVIRHLAPRMFKNIRLVGLDAFTHYDCTYSCAGLLGAVASLFDLPPNAARVLPVAGRDFLGIRRANWPSTWRDILDEACNVRIALVGVGSVKGGLMREVLAFLGERLTPHEEAVAVGDFRFTLLDASGAPIQPVRLNHLCLLGADRARELAGDKKLDRHVFVVASGVASKGEALRAVLRGEWANVLCTDQHMATWLLSNG